MPGMVTSPPREGAGQALGTARAPPRYSRHRPEDTLLYAIVEQHAERFFEQL